MHVNKRAATKKDPNLFLYITLSKINGFWCCFHCYC